MWKIEIGMEERFYKNLSKLYRAEHKNIKKDGMPMSYDNLYYKIVRGGRSKVGYTLDGGIIIKKVELK